MSITLCPIGSLFGAGTAGGALDTGLKTDGVGDWIDGNTFLKNFVYTENDWLGYPSVNTLDHLEPQLIGNSENSIDTDDFPITSNISIVRQVHKFTFTEDVVAQALQVFAPGWTFNTVSRIAVINNTTGNINVIDNPILDPNGFIFLAIGSSLISAGDQVDVVFELYNSTPASAINGDWTSNIGVGAPISEEFNIDNVIIPTIVQINHTDLNLGDRSTELDGVVSGSIIRLVESGSANRNVEFIVDVVDTSAPTSTSYTVLAGSITKGPQDIRDNRSCLIHIDIPVTLPTEYGVKAAFYPGGNPSWATITTELFYDGVLQAGSVDGFGINIIAQQATISPDWIVLAVSGGGGGGGTISPLNTKGDLYTFDTGNQRLPIGSDDQVLTVDATEPIGIIWKDPAGGGDGFRAFYFIALELDFPNVGLWPVSDTAPTEVDGNDTTFDIVAFDDTTEEGRGLRVIIPAGTTNILFDLKHRRFTGFGAADIFFKVYAGVIPGGTTFLGFPSNDSQILPMMTNLNYRKDTITIALSTLGLAAGDEAILEITRDAGNGGDDLSGDWYLMTVDVRFT